MVFRTLGFLIILLSTVAYGQGRKPAVEDFVGIEVDQPQVMPQGTESLYNLEQDMNKLEASKKATLDTAAPDNAATGFNPTSIIFGVSIFLGLPLIVWFLIMAQLRKMAAVESASNIEMLEKYRKEREKKNEASIKKAS